jgi:hypothetical protein
MSGFDYFIKNDYDLVFKTNLSTILNLDKFYECCNSILKTEDHIYHGIIGNYENFDYVSGAGMLLNKKSVNLILENKSEVSPSWTDDIFFGHILTRKYGITPKTDCMDRYNLVEDNQEVISESVINSTHIRIKVRIENRDVEFTNKVFDVLYN